MSKPQGDMEMGAINYGDPMMQDAGATGGFLPDINQKDNSSAGLIDKNARIDYEPISIMGAPVDANFNAFSVMNVPKSADTQIMPMPMM